MYEVMLDIIIESWQVLGQMSSYLLFGFLVAGILSVYVSPLWVEKNLGGDGLVPILKASFFGVPLPLCSCGVIPVATSMFRHGASRAATISFLLSTPQTGVDSIAVTYAMLGPAFAMYRPIIALLTGLFGGIIVSIFDVKDKAGSLDDEGDKDKAADKQEVCEDSCCDGNNKQGRLKRVLSYGFVTLPGDIGLALLLGVLIAGCVSVLVPPGQLAAYLGGGVLSILLLMIAGVPIYVCATASVPIAAGFMHMGATPGAALAFLIAGPATNAAAFTAIMKVLGRNASLLYILSVAISAFGSGLLLDWLISISGKMFSIDTNISHDHDLAGGYNHLWAIVLIAVMVMSYLMTYLAKKRSIASAD